jgi:hypothetical protein
LLSSITAGDLVTESPTLHSLGFQWSVEGDDNRNAEVSVQFRQKDTSHWQEALPLLRLKNELIDESNPYTTPNMFAGSIFDLTPGTTYEVKLTMTDPDGGGTQQIVTAQTRPVPEAFTGGRTLHV